MLILSSGTSSSSATICRSAMRIPVPRSTLPVYIVTVPSVWTARNESTWSRATGFAWRAVWAQTSDARLKDTTRAPLPMRNSRRVVSSIAMSGPPFHQRRGALHGGDDSLVGPAAAEVVLERLPNVSVGRARRPRIEEGRRLHHHAVDAVAALRRLLVDERPLHRRGLPGCSQALQRDHLARAHPGDGERAGPHRFAVDQHGARAALGQPTAVLRTVQGEVVAEDVEERGVRLDIHLVGLPVDDESDHAPSLSATGSNGTCGRKTARTLGPKGTAVNALRSGGLHYRRAGRRSLASLRG